jgi:hypothetical protein
VTRRLTHTRGAGPPGAPGPVRARLRAALRPPVSFFRAALAAPLTGAAFHAAAPRRRAR